MKKIVSLALVIVIMLTSFIACSNEKQKEAIEKYGSATLKVFLPGEYINKDIVKEFEKTYGVRVILELFDSNEMMYTKLQSGSKYDLLIPSDYMVERLINEGALTKLDASKIANIANLSKDIPYGSYKDYKMEDYGVPYFWGSVGIVYNHTKIAKETVESQGYSILHNPDIKGRAYVYDSERDSFMMAFKALGYSMNTSNEDEINEAYDWLIKMDETIDPSYVTDEVIDSMASGLKDLAIVYSGDAAYILSENEDMSYFMPKEGTNIWTDYMVIPENAETPLLAYEFINFMLTYDAAYANSEYVGYTSPVGAVVTDLTKEEAAYEGNEAYIATIRENDEFFYFNNDLQKKLSELWVKVLAH